ncbi:MAG TPA: DUF922 domain-containing protein [Croceibacterium sp.]
MERPVTALRIALTLVVLALATGVGLRPPADELHAAAVPPALAGIPGIKLEYYDVSGRTVAEIRASLDRNRPTDPATGAQFDAYTTWTMDWAIPGEPGGPCRLDQAKVMLDLTVGLPRLVDPDRVPRAVLDRWKRYRTALEVHEATHARNALLAKQAMLKAIRTADCATANGAAEDVLAELDYRDADYDFVTRHGTAKGAIFP